MKHKTKFQYLLITVVLFFALILSNSISVYSQPGNDLCANAALLTSSTTCNNTPGTITAATGDGIATACGGGVPARDVWYKFVAKSAYPTITISGLTFAGTAKMELFFGVCGLFLPLGCGTTSIDAATAPGGAGLTVGLTYYVRVWATNVPANGAFNICITDDVPATVDFGKSYINVTKGRAGGTVDPGDILQFQATFVVKNLTVDSVAYFDTVLANKGLIMVTNSMALRTNEGKIYSNGFAPFTDLQDADPAYLKQISGVDTAIRINIGLNSNAAARGKVRNTSKPSFYGSTCILMATYRVKVTGAYNTKINFGGGAFTFRDSATGVFSTINFPKDSIMIYKSPGLCPDAISATNTIGAETNGTFGTGAGSPIPKNRGTSAFVPTYIYQPFTMGAGGTGPQDYYYGISNNTGAETFTVLNNWAKPDVAPNHRVFTLWDIIGDHTGAANTAKGNIPCDTTKPVSAANPCGYMLIINSSYKTDTAFQYTVSSLCPNTYYEVSAWVRNICYRCGCDSTGKGSGSAGYIPLVPGDSSGVQPNLAFEINGTDYYTTGNIAYTGTDLSAPRDTTSQRSDTLNTWQKKGFVYQTGPSQTSFTLTIRNNAPGGGGNDWALDDISLATCNPVQIVNPGSTFASCAGSLVTTFRDTVSTYQDFTNYKYVRWEKSCNGGASWTTLKNDTLTYTTKVLTDSVATSTYSYSPVYADSGCIVRAKVATTSANLNDANCSTVASGNIRLDISNCTALFAQVINFTGDRDGEKVKLSWSTNIEIDTDYFTVERSYDGSYYLPVGIIFSKNPNSNTKQEYNFLDNKVAPQKVYYRLLVVSKNKDKKYSNTITLYSKTSGLIINSIANPFKNEINATVTVPRAGILEMELLNLFGKTITSQKIKINTGTNKVIMHNLANISSGTYFLRFRFEDDVINRSAIKIL